MSDHSKKSQKGGSQTESEKDFEFGNFEDSEAKNDTAEAAAEEEVPMSEGRKPPVSRKVQLKQWAKEELHKMEAEEENSKSEKEASTSDDSKKKTAEASASDGSTKKTATETNSSARNESPVCVGEEADYVGDAVKIETEVCEAFFAWTDCWNKGDLFGYLDAYWESDQTRYISEGLAAGNFAKGGVVITGRRDIDKVFTDVFVKMKRLQEKQKVHKGVAGFLTLRKLIVTPTGTNNAIVYGENQLEVAGDRRGTARGGVFTIHVRKMGGKWKIVSEHHTELPK